MAYALVSSIAAGLGQNGGTSSSIDTSGASLLVVVCGFDIRGGGLTLVDSNTNTWTALTTDRQAVWTTCRTYYALNPIVGSGHTFSFGGTDSYCSLVAASFSGADLSTPLDQQTGANNDAATSLATGSITPGTDNQLVVAALAFNNPATVTIGGSFNTPVTANAQDFVRKGASLSYLIQTTAAAANPTWTVSTTSELAAQISSYKAAAAAGIPPGLGPVVGFTEPNQAGNLAAAMR